MPVGKRVASRSGRPCAAGRSEDGSRVAEPPGGDQFIDVAIDQGVDLARFDTGWHLAAPHTRDTAVTLHSDRHLRPRTLGHRVERQHIERAYDRAHRATDTAVSYTHLTLPTILRV